MNKVRVTSRINSGRIVNALWGENVMKRKYKERVGIRVWDSHSIQKDIEFISGCGGLEEWTQCLREDDKYKVGVN